MKTLTLCISLAHSPRRDVFAAQAERHGIDFTFFDAITPDDLRCGFRIAGCTLDLTDLSWTAHDRDDPRHWRTPMLFTEIACAYSHIRVWQIAREHDVDRLVVFEDDAALLRGLDDLAMPASADLLYLGNRVPRTATGEASWPGCGTEGYVLTRAGIAKCLNIFSVLSMPIDLQLVAHQESQIRLDNPIARFRRDLPASAWLYAHVVASPVCLHPDDSVSTILSPADPDAALLAQVTSLKKERERSIIECARLAAERNHMSDELAARAAECARLAVACDRLAAERQAMLVERAEREAVHGALLNSTSWRVTRPLRALRRWLG